MSWFSKLEEKLPFGKPKKRVLFICTGNTCRSPMAATIFKSLSKGKYDVDSAGVSPHPGDPASTNAVKAMEVMGLDLSQHRSKQVTKEIIESADLVLVMSQRHLDIVKSLCPTANVELISPQGIADPYGGSEKRYQDSAEELKKSIEPRIGKI